MGWFPVGLPIIQCYSGVSRLRGRHRHSVKQIAQFPGNWAMGNRLQNSLQYQNTDPNEHGKNGVCLVLYFTLTYFNFSLKGNQLICNCSWVSQNTGMQLLRYFYWIQTFKLSWCLNFCPPGHLAQFKYCELRIVLTVIN